MQLLRTQVADAVRYMYSFSFVELEVLFSKQRFNNSTANMPELLNKAAKGNLLRTEEVGAAKDCVEGKQRQQYLKEDSSNRRRK